MEIKGITLREVILLRLKLNKLPSRELLELKEDPKLTLKEFEAVQDEILKRLK